MNTIYHRNFRKMKKLGILLGESVEAHVKIDNEPFMPLSVQVISKTEDGVQQSLTHYYTQNGDLMADPDMLVEINYELETVEVLHYQQDGLGIFQLVYQFDENGKKTHVRAKLKRDLNKFLGQWLTNLKQQGFSKKKAA